MTNVYIVYVYILYDTRYCARLEEVGEEGDETIVGDYTEQQECIGVNKYRLLTNRVWIMTRRY